MAKINASKSFDKALLDSKFVQQAELFIDDTNQKFDQVIRALTSGLTFADNIKSAIQPITCYHNKVVTVVPTGTVLYAFPIRQSSPIRSMDLVFNTNNQMVITFKFDEPIPVKTRNVTVTATTCANYDVQTNSTIAVGDLVSITGKSNPNNNGTFLVIKASTTSISVMNPSAAAETNASYSGAIEPSKTVYLLTLFQ